jgi:hypothetical protein
MNSAAPEINRLFLQRRDRWRSQGLSMRASGILARAGCDAIEDVARLGRAYFETRSNCGCHTLAELAVLGGWPPKSRTMVDVIATVLRLAVADAGEAREVAQDVALALRRAGFVVTAKRGHA